MSPRTGRPVVGEAKDIMMRVRISKEDDHKLEECAEALATSKSEVIRKGIAKVHDELFPQNKK